MVSQIWEGENKPKEFTQYRLHHDGTLFGKRKKQSAPRTQKTAWRLFYESIRCLLGKHDKKRETEIVFEIEGIKTENYRYVCKRCDYETEWWGCTSMSLKLDLE